MKYGGTENEKKTRRGFMSEVNNTVLAIGIGLGIATSGVAEAQAQGHQNQMAIRPAQASFILDTICNDPAMFKGSKIPKSACNVTDNKSLSVAQSDLEKMTKN